MDFNPGDDQAIGGGEGKKGRAREEGEIVRAHRVKLRRHGYFPDAKYKPI